MFFAVFLTPFLFLGVNSDAVDGERDYKRVCYYTSNLQPENVPPDLCTHLIYAFAKLDGNEIRTLEWGDSDLYKRFNALKSKSKNLKTLIAIGGWNAGTAVFSQMARSSADRNSFVKSVIRFCRTHGFDGFDLDWEYPGLEDKEHYVLLLKELRTEFEREARLTKSDPLLLTAAVPIGKERVDLGFDVPKVSRYLDFINLMTYDFHGGWESVTGENAPLYARSTEHGDQRYLNVEWAANYWIEKSAPREKLIIGMATYGRFFTLADPNSYGVGAKTTWNNGFLSYHEICHLEEMTKGTTYWDNEAMVPYFVDGTLWVGFDNVRSITMKTQWLMKEDFGGAMVWTLAHDDHSKTCKSSPRRYPLISTICDVLTGNGHVGEQSLQSGTTISHTKKESTIYKVLTAADKGLTGDQMLQFISTIRETKKESPTMTSSLPPNNLDEGFSCDGRHSGFHLDPKNCNAYYVCNYGYAYHFTCPNSLRFNIKLSVCDWSYNVHC